MKVKYNIGSMLLAATVVLGGIVFQACEDEPDKYEVSKGTPTVLYARIPDAVKADSLITGAYMGTTICLVGNNLRSITEMYFNDQKAVLNTSMITEHTLIVAVPKTLSDNPTDKIYMVNSKNDTTAYDFKVQVPVPIVASISCEYAKPGELATINGDYLLSYASDPMQISFPGNLLVTKIEKITKTAVTFRIPEGAEQGYITVKTKYGVGRSNFIYRDNRGMILDMDNTTGSGSWVPGNYDNKDPEGIDGNYLSFNGTLTSWGTWNSTFFFHYWGKKDFSDLDPAKAVMKFEVNCPKKWLGVPLMIILEPEVDPSAGRSPYIDDAADFTPAQCHWTPYANSGSYQTNGWVTVTIPLSDFKYNKSESVSNRKINSFKGLRTLFMGFFGALPDGVESNTIKLCIDNVRIVPAE